MKVVVLWISRHKPLKAQLDYLRDRLGDFKLIQYNKPLATAQNAVELVKQYNADYIVPVLPMTFVMHLVQESRKYRFTVLRANMINLHNCSEQPCRDYNPYTDTIVESRDLTTGQRIYRHFRFDGFRVLKDIKFIEEVF